MSGPSHPGGAHAAFRPGVLAAFGLLFVLMAVLCALTPFMSDDYVFSRAPTQPFSEIMAGEPVQAMPPATPADAFRRAAQMWRTWDGRFMSYVVHGLVLQAPAWIHAVYAPLIMCLLTWAAVAHLRGSIRTEEMHPLLVAGMAACLMLGMPSFGSAFFWRTGLAYATGMCCALLFLLPWRLRLDDALGPEGGRHAPPSAACAAGFGLFGLFLGLLEFNTPILCALLGAAGIAWLWMRLRPARASALETLLALRMHLAGLAGVILGLAAVFSAPGNAQRVIIRESWFLELDVVDKIAAHLLEQPRIQALFWPAWLLLAWAAAVLIARFGRDAWRRCPPTAWAGILAGQLGQAAYAFAPGPDGRAYSSAFVLMFLGSASLARAAWAHAGARARAAARIAGACLALHAICLVPAEISLFADVRAAMAERDAVYAHSAGDAVRVPPLAVRGDRLMVLGTYQQDIDYDPGFWINQAVAAFWGMRSVALEMPPARVLASPEAPDVRLVVHGGRIRAERGGETPLHVYYHGRPGLSRYLPQGAADGLARRLADAAPGAWRLVLVPVLFSRADIPPGGEPGGTPLTGIFPGAHPLWLVRPGQGALSLDLLPLRDVDAPDGADAAP